MVILLKSNFLRYIFYSLLAAARAVKNEEKKNDYNNPKNSIVIKNIAQASHINTSEPVGLFYLSAFFRSVIWYAANYSYVTVYLSTSSSVPRKSLAAVRLFVLISRDAPHLRQIILR